MTDVDALISAFLGGDTRFSVPLYTQDAAARLSDHLDGNELRESHEVIVLRNGQYVFREVVERYMKQISYDSDGIAGYANRLLLPGWEVAEIAVKPGVNYGQPYFVRNGTPLSVVEDSLRGGTPGDDVAAEHGLPDDQVAEVDAYIQQTPQHGLLLPLVACWKNDSSARPDVEA